MGLTEHDERWLRLAILIHKTANDTLKDVLEKLLKELPLRGTNFEERLCDALKKNESELRNIDKEHLLPYEIEKVYPGGSIGTTKDIDVGILIKLIKFFVGNDVWNRNASVRRSYLRKKTVDVSSIDTYGCVKLLGDYRNFVFHHTCDPPISESDFTAEWKNISKILSILGYDSKKIDELKTMPLYNTSVAEALLEVIKQRDDRVQQDFMKSVRMLENVIKALKEEFITKDDVKVLCENFDEPMKNRHDELLTKFVEMESKFKIIEGKKESLQSENESLPMIERNIEDSLLQAIESLSHEFKTLCDATLASRNVVMQKIELVCSQLIKLEEATMSLRDQSIQNENIIQDDLFQAQQACRKANQTLLNRRVLDGHGKIMEGGLRTDVLMPSLIEEPVDLEKHWSMRVDDFDLSSQRRSPLIESVQLHDIFKKEDRVLVSGLPKSGKSIFCREILRLWNEGKLWKDRYDLLFYINSPDLMHLMRAQPFTMERALRVLYPEVFKRIAYKDLCKFAIILDSVDEVNLEKICSGEQLPSFEDAITEVIVSRESFDRIIVGRWHACKRICLSLIKDIPYRYLEVVCSSTEV